MFIIKKQFDFSASHRLSGLPVGHKCGRLHGHSYSVIVSLSRKDLNGIGFVKDYGELDFVKAFINTTIDHRHLNDIVDFNPTAENLARWFYNELSPYLYGLLTEVEVKETVKTSAIYIPDVDQSRPAL